MDADKVLQDLNRRFNAPLPEFYNRRIIFWKDEDGEFEDKVDELVPANVKLIKLTGSNLFAVKKLLTVDDITSDYLVYCPIQYNKLEDNWLLNIELFSGETFRADLNTIWMDEMGLTGSELLRRSVKSYHRFFNSKERRAKFSTFAQKIATPSQMHLGVMAVLCGCSEPEPGAILRAVLIAGLKKEENEPYKSLVNFGADKPFWVLVAQATGYNGGDDPSLSELAVKMIMTAATRTLREEYLAGLDSYISMPHQSFCYDFVNEWLHSDDCNAFYRISRHVEDELRLFQRFTKLEAETLADTECFPCVNEIILIKLMTEISNNIIRTDAIRQIAEKRRTCVWYSRSSCYYDALVQVANMQVFFQEHSAGFHTMEQAKLWKEYTSDYYRMDSFYRQFHLRFGEALKKSNPLLDDLLKQVAEQVEGQYTVWFMGGLAGNWQTAYGDALEKTGHIEGIPCQTNFYKDKVQSADSRVFVVISDALRYEVAAQLSDELRRETQSKVTLSSMCGIFPSITPFGMAALLPHDTLTLEEKVNRLAVLADGMSTEADAREAVLKKKNPASVVLKYKNIVGMKMADRRALVKGAEVVYIYHDKVDESSHTSDSAVFPACNEAIDELKNILRIVCNEFSGTKVYITADHGFLYTYQPLTEDAKLGKENWNGMDVEYGRRYAIMRKGAHPAYLQPVHFLNGDTPFEAFAPKENIRIRMNGGGLTFVHGGISPQEMVVPLIEYTYLRNDSKEYKRNRSQYDTKPVTVNLLSASRKISNMIFSLNFYQKDAVSYNREACTYEVYFTDITGKIVSDTVKIIADRTSEEAQERTFRCNFNLKSLQFDSKATYYLVIADASGLQMPVREEFQIDIAFAIDEFNFF